MPEFEKIAHLDASVPIVTPNRTPTPQFLRFFQQLVGNGGLAVPSNREIIAGVGLDGGGDLSEDRTLSLESVTPDPTGSYTNANIDVDEFGRVIAASNGGAGGGSNTQSEASFNYPDLTAFTWFQQGSSAATADAIGTAIQWANGVNIRSLTTAAPAAPYDVYGRFSWTSISGVMHAGLCLRQAANSKHIGVNVIPNTQFYVQSYNGNSFNNNWSNIDVRQDSASMWFRIHVTSTSNIDFYVSHDGILWLPVGLAVNPSAFLTVDSIGIWMRCDSGAPICRVSYFDTVAPSV